MTEHCLSAYRRVHNFLLLTSLCVLVVGCGLRPYEWPADGSRSSADTALIKGGWSCAYCMKNIWTFPDERLIYSMKLDGGFQRFRLRPDKYVVEMSAYHLAEGQYSGPSWPQRLFVLLEPGRVYWMRYQNCRRRYVPDDEFLGSAAWIEDDRGEIVGGSRVFDPVAPPECEPTPPSDSESLPKHWI